MAILFGAMLLVASTVEARTGIGGYGKVRFGNSLEQVKAAYPNVRKDAGNGWTCDVEAPFLLAARVRFLFDEENALDYVQVAGTVTGSELGSALIEKYGQPDSAGEEWVPMAGQAVSATWNDDRGNRLWLQIYYESGDAYLRYMSAARAKAEDKNAAEEKRRQLEGL